MYLTRTLKAGAALFTVFSLAACGQSRNQDVVAEDIFAPAVETDDVAIDTVQTVFDDPFAAEAQLITDAGDGGELDPFIQQQTALTDATVPVVPVMTAPVYQEQMPVVQQPIIQQPPQFNCGIAPTSKSQLMMFRQYCGGIAPQGGGFGGQGGLSGVGAPAQQVFMSPSFDCGMSPSSKAELAYFRANCLGAVAAPIAAPQSAPVAIEPQQQFVEEFVEEVIEAAPEPTPESYDCNILPTSRAELELYQQFCG